MSSGLVEARLQGFRTGKPGDLAAVIAVFAWAGVAFFWRDPHYDALAVLASTAVLAAAIGFYRWKPPEHLSGYRLLGFAAMGQAFLSSGMSLLIEVQGVRLRPTVEAFSFAVHSTVLFTFVFVAAAAISAPRARAHREPDQSGPDAGPTNLLALGLALGTATLTVYMALAGSNRFGSVPLILLNPALLIPLFAARRLLRPGSNPVFTATAVGGQAVSTFFTSSLGALILGVRDIVLVHVHLRRALPKWLLALGLLTVLVLNPAKHAFRKAYQQQGGTDTEVTAAKAAEWWRDGLTATWSGEIQSEQTSSALESTARRTSYNDVIAHIHETVPSHLDYEMGATYGDVAVMLIPRILYPGKPNSQYVRERWLVRSGIQSETSVEKTAVALPAPAEAYWNFGWLGVPVVAAMMGLAVGLLLRLRPRDPAARAAFSTLLATAVSQSFLDMMVWAAPVLITLTLSVPLVELYCRLGKRVRDRGGAAHRALRTDPRLL